MIPKWDHSNIRRMRIISEKALREFGQQHPDAKESLETWKQVVKEAKWEKQQDILTSYPTTADPVGADRAVFNIRRNRYRIVVMIHYVRQIVYIRFVGTHAEYDRIDAATI